MLISETGGRKGVCSNKCFEGVDLRECIEGRVRGRGWVKGNKTYISCAFVSCYYSLFFTAHGSFMRYAPFAFCQA